MRAKRGAATCTGAILGVQVEEDVRAFGGRSQRLDGGRPSQRVDGGRVANLPGRNQAGPAKAAKATTRRRR